MQYDNEGLHIAEKGNVMKNPINTIIRRFQTADACELSAMIATTLREVNSRDYTPDQIEALVASLSPEVITTRAEQGHMYVVCDDEKIIGTGCIAGYWGSTTESILLTIFVHPAYHGQGVGRSIIETLEQDTYFLRASRIEIPASITAVEFYRKMGYDYKNGIRQLDEEHTYRLEKFHTPTAL